MSLGSKYKKINEFNKRLIKFKKVIAKIPETQKKKSRIMKNVDELHEKYYDVYKDDYDTNDELNQAKKKGFDYTKFKVGNKIDKVSKRTALTKWLSSKNDFNKQ